MPALIVAGVAFAVYANTLPNDFVDDDTFHVLRNPWIRDFRFLPEIFSHKDRFSFGHETAVSNLAYYRPLRHVVYLVVTHIFGFRAWGFHLFSALFHVVNSLLVLVVAARLVPNAGGAPGRGRMAFLLSFPFAAALLFATHPVHVEAVAWISSITELMFTGLYLFAFVLYAAAEGRRSPALVAGSVLLFFSALLCKETAITLPAILVVYDVAFRQTRPWSRRLRLYALYAAAAAVYLVLRDRVMSETLISERGSWNLSGSELVLNGLVLFRTYLEKLILPVRLRFWHSFHPISSLATLEGLSALVIACLVLAAAFVAWRKDKASFFFIALIVIPLTPAFNINALPGRPFAERYLYLPSVGFVLLVARVLSRLVRSGTERVTLAVLLTVTALYTAGTVARNRVWKSQYTLFSDTVTQSPDAPIPRYYLANTLASLGRLDDAIAQYRIVLQASPENARYHLELGNVLLAQGRLDEALAEFRTTNSLDPASPEALNDLGAVSAKRGDHEAAAALYRQALAIDKDYANAHFNLGVALADQGKHDEALEHYRKAVEESPENAYWRAVLGIECAEQGRIDEALVQFEEAVRLAPDEPAYRQDHDRALALRKSRAAQESVDAPK